ncbi:MAG: protein translocase SEC61 complex subunit gamma [Candidatus Altiarchaeales archaeon]|nr:MAG: protein translocase SEC61 complex subunit gamma [Candidatus Altiarchaeales archaeon]RLI94882.1 MAG: protein translocase SEC61 complex subunit gamma [Candidatus Altiarchaeales archaeon]RLI94980.1 MAG: protein translocase SEC61 complex subunit gamma [Candidatus Altiarchaeales archaeon]HDO82732.1 protein translocase SEC61 complex subunit gamma [Candidatus Altiarchaeales archaeon]HEX55381.1 protein translocase SEC61 complex subunit gamma [Candidatus Altiarchaeales archaeon]
MISLGKAYRETRRILRLTRKPKMSEFIETAKITGLGMIIIGFIGFIILIIAEILF